MSLLTLKLAREVNLKLYYNGEIVLQREGNMIENDKKHSALINA